MLNFSTKLTVPLPVASACVYAAPQRLQTSQTVNASGIYSFVVTNTSNVLLTGMTIHRDDYDAAGKQTARGTSFFDSFLNRDTDKLAPDQSHTFEMNSNGGRLDIRVDAAIFSDGYADGDQEAIQYLWDQRKWMAIGYKQAFQDFDTEVADVNDREAVVQLCPK